MKTPLSLSSAQRQHAGSVWVSAVAMINCAGHILMQQRPVNKDHGLLWEFPGGKVEPREAPDRAAVRELREELGVTVDVNALEPISFATAMNAAQMPLTILLFACRTWKGEPEPREAPQLTWCAPEKLSQLAMPPLDYSLAAALCAHLRGMPV